MRIDARRIRPAELLALLSAVLVVVALFLPWYEVADVRKDAWQALTVTRWVVLVAALTGIALFAATLTQRTPARPVALAVWTTVIGLVAVVVVAVRTLTLPGLASDRCYGLWLGLAGSVGLLAAGWLSLRDERPFWGVPSSGLPQR